MEHEQNIVSCIFCQPETFSNRRKSRHFYLIADRFPVTTGHHLIIPFRHIPDPLELTAEEMTEAWELIKETAATLQQNDPSITGFNIGMNCGQSAGQTIFHTHIHLIPRRQDDVANPRGGVRGVIPTRQNY
ncbi:MAG: HIT domain-containing protein [Deltaproteobacteria bacterium]|nr:HIT domain-containing protein [Candidatus Anaeroferrophillus wilburensis]MBN2889502.1 HIT domain-containing protein [Deltaproteobacteria bacterium]